MTINMSHRALLVCEKKDGSYLANRALPSVFPIVTRVTGSEGRNQPISRDQLAEITEEAVKEGVRVVVVGADDWEKIKEHYQLGEAELSRSQARWLGL